MLKLGRYPPTPPPPQKKKSSQATLTSQTILFNRSKLPLCQISITKRTVELIPPPRGYGQFTAVKTYPLTSFTWLYRGGYPLELRFWPWLNLCIILYEL